MTFLMGKHGKTIMVTDFWGTPFLRQTHVLCQGLYNFVSTFHHAPPALLFHPMCPQRSWMSQVFIAMNITRGMPWFRREKDPGSAQFGSQFRKTKIVSLKKVNFSLDPAGWFVVGNRRVVERLNRDWLEAWRQST